MIGFLIFLDIYDETNGFVLSVRLLITIFFSGSHITDHIAAFPLMPLLIKVHLFVKAVRSGLLGDIFNAV